MGGECLVWHAPRSDCEEAGSKGVGRDVLEREFCNLVNNVPPIRPGKPRVSAGLHRTP
jgi:hypothetical protein